MSKETDLETIRRLVRMQNKLLKDPVSSINRQKETLDKAKQLKKNPAG